MWGQELEFQTRIAGDEDGDDGEKSAVKSKRRERQRRFGFGYGYGFRARVRVRVELCEAHRETPPTQGRELRRFLFLPKFVGLQ